MGSTLYLPLYYLFTMRALAHRKSHNKFLEQLSGTIYILLILIELNLYCFGYSLVFFQSIFFYLFFYFIFFIFFPSYFDFFFFFCLCFIGVEPVYVKEIGSRAIPI